MRFDADITYLDPVFDNYSTISLHEFLTAVHPVPPERYEKYYNEVLIPLLERLESLKEFVAKLPGEPGQ